MIVQAAVPLLVAMGPAVTTLQIARAAGISEPTIFRAFATKEDVLAACLAEVTDPRHVVDELAAIEPDPPLRDRMIAAIEVIRAQGERTGAVANAVQVAVTSRPRRHQEIPAEERDRLAGGRAATYTRMHEAVTDVLAPDAAALRIPVGEAATLVLAVVMALGRGGGWDVGAASVSTDGLADLLLHGIAGAE
jgi:AcrR family transcriptional regulator